MVVSPAFQVDVVPENPARSKLDDYVGSPRMAWTSAWVMPVWTLSKFSLVILVPQPASQTARTATAARSHSLGHPLNLMPYLPSLVQRLRLPPGIRVSLQRANLRPSSARSTSPEKAAAAKAVTSTPSHGG
jgi:hypothetical protein